MPGVAIWAWDTDNNVWVKIKTDSLGRLYTVAVIDELDDIGDVYVPTPTDGYMLYWNDGNSRWECKAVPVSAHKDSHDPQDGSDKLDAAAPVKVGSANAEGSSHSFARADHVHEREHAIYTDAAAKAAAVQAGAITNAVTKAPTHDAVYDVKVTADAAQPAATDAAAAVDAIEADDNLPVASITFIIDGGGEAITAAEEKGHLRIPFACTINNVMMLADVAGAIVVDIWKDTYANFPPTDADSITASAPPTIAATNQKSSDSTLTGWTTAIAAGDILAFNVDSCTTIKRVTISLKVTKT